MEKLHVHAGLEWIGLGRDVNVCKSDGVSRVEKNVDPDSADLIGVEGVIWGGAEPGVNEDPHAWARSGNRSGCER
jgi:hypothetical protein